MVVGHWSHRRQLSEGVSAMERSEEERDLQYLSRKLSSKLIPRKFPYTTLPVATAFWGSGTSSACDVWIVEREDKIRSDLKRERAKAIFAAGWQNRNEDVSWAALMAIYEFGISGHPSGEATEMSPLSPESARTGGEGPRAITGLDSVRQGSTPFAPGSSTVRWGSFMDATVREKGWGLDI